MKNRDYLAEQLSDVKNLHDHAFVPGEYVPYDINLFYFGGFMP